MARNALLCLCSCLAISASTAPAATVNIVGTHTVPDANVSASGNYRPFKIDTSVLFDPLSGPITVTGSVDTSGLPQSNSTVYVGLISKIEYDNWVNAGYDPNNSISSFFGFIDTAYAGFNTSQSGRLGLGQHIPGDFVQSYVGNNLGTLFDDFELIFNAANYSLSNGGAPIVRAYVNTYDYLTGATVPTDWSQGAYAFVGTWFDKAGGSAVVDLTFSGPGTTSAVVPEPTSMALFGMGVVALAGCRTARRRKETDA